MTTTSKQVKECIALRDSGYTIPEIAARTGLVVGTVRKHLKAEGWRTEYAMIFKIMEMYAPQGLPLKRVEESETLTDLAAATGIGYQKLWRIMDRLREAGVIE